NHMVYKHITLCLYVIITLISMFSNHFWNIPSGSRTHNWSLASPCDISNDGSLKLKDLTLADEGIYKAEVFDSDGTKKISKPSVKFTCSDKDVIFTCALTNTEGVTFKWKPVTFTCYAINKFSMETSDAIKPICKAVSVSSDRRLLFGLDFWTMVCILAGGGGLVLLIITLVCCCLIRRKSQMCFEEEEELRLAPLTKTQHPSHPEGKKQRQRPLSVSTGPRPTARASSQAAPL
uniref:Immunoglobulin subtype domain-containing protein n=1 Tax=Hucho hucho TaxID=62062 RepID=A0A4W5R0E7_9TELE